MKTCIEYPVLYIKLAFPLNLRNETENHWEFSEFDLILWEFGLLWIIEKQKGFHGVMISTLDSE